MREIGRGSLGYFLLIVAYCGDIPEVKDISGMENEGAVSPLCIWGLMTMEVIQNMQRGRTRALSEMRKARRYGNLRRRSGNVERG